MADFSALKTSIQNYIKQNGNEEITGNLLQQILLSMVSTLGDSAINDLVTALNNEVTARQNADETLQTNINNEATARGNADTQLGNRITSEAETREGADNTLRGLIDGIIDDIENGYVYAGIATPATTPASGKVFYLALNAGTYTNFGATVVPQGINILKYNGSAWVLDSFLGLDNVPTQGSNNLVKSGGVLDSIIKDGSAFDLSAYNSGATYAGLSAALSALNALPAAYKRGGMSIKFVQTSDNKYVQYFCVSNLFTTDTSYWKRIDLSVINNITTGGTDVALSAEMGKEIGFISGIPGIVEKNITTDDYFYLGYKAVDEAPAIDISDALKVSVCTVMNFASTYPIIRFYDDSDNALDSLMYDDFSHPGNFLCIITDYTVPQGAVFMRIVAWNESAFNAQKNNCYIKKYINSIIGGSIGDVKELHTQEKSNVVSAINELADNSTSIILDSNNTVQIIEHCRGDENSFTMVSSSVATGMAVWKAGANNYVRILNSSNISCIVATETVPQKGPTGTTQMAQFKPELLAQGIDNTRIMFNHVVMPSDKDYLVVYYITESLDNLVFVPSIKERMALEERSNLNIFAGKKISFMGDSLFNDGPKICQYFSWMSGMQIINGDRNLLSKGGYPTLTVNGVENCMQARAHKLENLPEPNVLVIENVNDGQGEDYTNAELASLTPFMLVDWNDFLPGVQSAADARSYFTTNFATLVGGITPHLGSMIRVAYGTSSFKITITSVATSNGDASIIIGSDTYTVTLSTSMTKADIAALFAAYNFSGFMVDYTAGEEYFDLVEIGSGTTVDDITYDAGTTGSQATKAQTSSYGYVGYCYYSDTVTEWNNSENWVEADNLPLIAQYKGLVEYLCTTFPDMWVFWLLAMRYDNDSARYRNARLRKYLPQWGIPYLDVETAASINIWNYRNFCEAGIHINQYNKGAMRWAEAMVRCLL